MNNLAYANQKPEEIANKVEQLLRKELGGDGMILYEIEEENAPPTGANTMLKDFWTAMKGGVTTRLLTLHFHLKAPRAFDLDVTLNRQGAGCYAGPLVYKATLAKPVSGEVQLGEDGKFTGDAALSGKLNAVKDVLKQCAAFAVQKGGISGFELTIPRLLKIAPEAGKTQLVAVTLPRSKSMGFSATFNSKEFFELLPKLEAVL